MGILGFIILGLMVGAIVKAARPGRDGPGWRANLVLGVLGALVGGWLASALLGVDLGTFFDARTWLLAVVGGFLITLAYGARKSRRPRTPR